MYSLLNRKNPLKKLSRLVLGMFLLSLFNMSLQVPAHAAMQYTMQSPVVMNHADMGHDMSESDISKHDMSGHGVSDNSMSNNSNSMSEMNCHCPPALCETVDAQQDQFQGNLSHLVFIDAIDFYPSNSAIHSDSQDQLVAISYQQNNRQYYPLSSVPLSLISQLLI